MFLLFPALKYSQPSMCYMHFTAANTFLIMIHLFVYGHIDITLKGQVHVVVECRKTQIRKLVAEKHEPF